MKTQKFYQSTKPSKREATILDLVKGFGYYLTAFVIAVGGILAIILLSAGGEALSNLFKQKEYENFQQQSQTVDAIF